MNKNPFTLTFGKQPEKYINRDMIINEILEMFEGDNPVSQTYLISGVRGSGKTVLMTTIEKRLKEEGNWIIVDLNASVNLLIDLKQRLIDACKRIPNIFDRGFEVSIAGFGIGVESKDNNQDDVSIIEHILEELLKKHKKVLITIDEATASDNMRSFASQFQIMVRKDYPVYLLMTGLYDEIYSIQNDVQLTFLLRSPKAFLEPLSLSQIKAQYKEIFNYSDEVALEMAYITKGYAFAFQALGYLCWQESYIDHKELIIAKLDSILDDYVYKKIWEGCSNKERQIITYMCHKENIEIKDIYTTLDMSTSTFSKYRDRLLKKGVIVSKTYGHIELSLPRFDDVIETY